MKWLKALLGLWKGEMFEEEIRKTREVVDEAKKAIREGRATLNGEDQWLRRDKDHCARE